MRFLRSMLLLALFTTFLLVLTAHALTIKVDCRLTSHLTITAAVAKIAAANPLGPNTITVTGNCHENVVISSLDNLTLQASHRELRLPTHPAGRWILWRWWTPAASP